MRKLISSSLILMFLLSMTIGCAKTEAEKQADAQKKADNNLLLLLLILSASRSSSSSCSYYGTSGGCYSSAPYSCPASNYCSSSSTCSNLSCDMTSNTTQKTENKTSATCDSSKFECLTRNKVSK